MAELEGKVIAVSGAAGGLGPSVARALRGAGATLALCDLDEGALGKLEGELGAGDDRLATSAVDLLDLDRVEGWRDEVLERFGRIDGVAHLVGGWRGGDPFPEAPMEDYEWLHDGLVRTLQHVSRAFHRALTESDGTFTIVSSTAAASPDGESAAYAATKAAAEAWTLALADSFAGTGARANVIVVKAILTPAMREEDPEADFEGLTPAEHIAELLRWLQTPAAAELNGRRIPLHG